MALIKRSEDEQERIEYDARLFPVGIFGFEGEPENLIYCDAAINEGHEVVNEVTTHPVEFGANISDHGIVQPRQFLLTGRISPLDTHGRADLLTGATRRGAVAWGLMRDAARNSTPLTIETNLELYEGFILTRLRTGQDARNSLGLAFEATFQEVLIVQTKTAQSPASAAGPTNEQFSETVDAGVVQPTPLEIGLQNQTTFEE